DAVREEDLLQRMLLRGAGSRWRGSFLRHDLTHHHHQGDKHCLEPFFNPVCFEHECETCGAGNCSLQRIILPHAVGRDADAKSPPARYSRIGWPDFSVASRRSKTACTPGGSPFTRELAKARSAASTAS